VNRLPRKQTEVLKHHRDAGNRLRDMFLTDPDLAHVDGNEANRCGGVSFCRTEGPTARRSHAPIFKSSRTSASWRLASLHAVRGGSWFRFARNRGTILRAVQLSFVGHSAA
jgi:hypothetical protein